MAKVTVKVNYELEWHGPEETPGSTENCYVTIRHVDRAGRVHVWVQEGCYEEGSWGEYNPEYDSVDYDAIDDDEVASWSYKPGVQPYLGFVEEV